MDIAAPAQKPPQHEAAEQLVDRVDVILIEAYEFIKTTVHDLAVQFMVDGTNIPFCDVLEYNDSSLTVQDVFYLLSGISVRVKRLQWKLSWRNPQLPGEFLTRRTMDALLDLATLLAADYDSSEMLWVHLAPPPRRDLRGTQ